MQQQKGLITQIKQQYARQKFDEINLRRSVGQTKLAASLLQQFPVETLPAETQLQLRSQVENLKQELLLLAELLKDLDACVASLTPEQQQAIEPVISELKTEVNLTTVSRLSDFKVLRADPSIAKENLVAYAVGGWLLGGGAGIDNFAIAQSLFRVRELITDYLNESTPQRRSEILNTLRGEEGAQPQYVAKLLAIMKPPIASEPVVDGEAESQASGLYRLSVRDTAGEEMGFLVQTPPEYDPNQKYPCVLALGGIGDSPQLEIDWWCGQQFGGNRYGQATRRGYIVVSPDWRLPQSYEYEYTEVEHDRVLRCYREALRRFSIDTARVFIAGHHDGATAAWDIGVSHPSLWAGIVAISPGADKHLVHYSDNIAAPRDGQPPLGVYIVYGEYDGKRFSNQLGSVGTEYLKNPKYEAMVVEYRGNGSLRFSAELPRIFEWLEIAGQRRLQDPEARFPRQIRARTMRSSDRFFYWLEAPQLLSTTYSNPLNFDFKKSGLFEAKILEGADNTIMVTKIPSEPRNSALIWLHPSMVDFDKPLNIRVAGRNNRVLPEEMRPDIAIMLEDARTRGERQYVYWQRAAIR
jgi:predicted esterase